MEKKRPILDILKEQNQALQIIRHEFKLCTSQNVQKNVWQRTIYIKYKKCHKFYNLTDYGFSSDKVTIFTKKVVTEVFRI